MTTRTWVLSLLVAGVSTGALAQERYEMALTGDSIITRKLSVYDEPDYLRMIELIRDADLAFTNIEMLFHDYEYSPMASSGGTYMRAQPELARELSWAGFDIGSLANNHSGDYGPETMLLSERYVREAGIVAAGVGRSLAEAREAKFLETAGGRVALISLSSTFPEHSRAGKSRDDVPARPGLNPLRHNVTYQVTREQLESLRRIMRALGQNVPEASDTLRFRGERYVVADRPGIVTEPVAEDVDEIAMVVRNAARLSDYTIVSIHAHESGSDRSVPADFITAFARRMIEEGADVFVGHGPHVLRGIEIHNGKPIFYSLGDFLFQNETLQRLPWENYEGQGLDEKSGLADFNDARYDNGRSGFPANPEIWEAVIASPVFQGETLVSLELHPISLGFGEPPQVRGRPRFAEPELARKIIGDLAERSRPFGTEIDFVDGIGVVRLGASTN